MLRKITTKIEKNLVPYEKVFTFMDRGANCRKSQVTDTLSVTTREVYLPLEQDHMVELLITVRSHRIFKGNKYA